MSLLIPAAYASSKVWINGELVSEIGIVGKTKENTLHRRFKQLLPLNTNENEFEIVIQVANFYHLKGGLTAPPIIGPSKYLNSLTNQRTISDMIYIGSLSFIGFFFLFFFLFYWNRDRAVLYFAIICICWAYRSFNNGYAPLTLVFPNISWSLFTKLEYGALFIGSLSGSLFFTNIFYSYVHKFYFKIIGFVFAIFGLLLLALPTPYFTKLVMPFIIVMSINLAYIIFVIIRASFGKTQESILSLVSIGLGAVILISEILFFFDENSFSKVYINVGYILSFLIVSMLLMFRFSRSFMELERTKEFAVQQQKEISKKSNQITKANINLRKNLKLLKKYNTELDNFVHIISHDLKTPLSAMSGLVSFIEEDLKAKNEDDVEIHIKLLKNRVLKMGSLTDDLLTYYKLLKGTKTKKIVKLNDLLSTILKKLNSTNEHTVNLPEGNPKVYANEAELWHVFQNLIQNCILHNDKDRVIIDISLINDGNYYLFSVEDNGPGIDSKYHKKIFEMFAQLNPEKDVKSTGVGLAIVEKIISDNQGTISITSKEGAGTCIKFSLKIDTKFL